MSRDDETDPEQPTRRSLFALLQDRDPRVRDAARRRVAERAAALGDVNAAAAELGVTVGTVERWAGAGSWAW